MMEKSKILIVDDKPANLLALEKILDSVDVEIVTAPGGNEALMEILDHSFALAILDVQMPEMDGYELAELIRGQKATKELPIIFLSAVYSASHSVFKGYQTGAVDFLTKPIEPEIILNKVNVFVDLDQQKRELERRNELLQKEVDERMRAELQLGKLVVELQDALENIKTLKGLLPICAKCKKVRDDKGYWSLMEQYIETHTDALISHGICPECEKELYGHQKWYKKLHGQGNRGA